MNLARLLRSWRLPFTLCIAVGAFLGMAPTAAADFITPYSLTDFLLTNVSADGSVSTPDGGQSIVFTGGNTGSGKPGFTTLIATALASGFVQFQFSYFSNDSPGGDAAGYLVNGVFTFLADTSGEASTSPIDFSVNAGDTFGFEITTVDNTGEPGVLTVADFSAPTSSSTTSVPEPETAPVIGVVLVTAALAGRKWVVSSGCSGRNG